MFRNHDKLREPYSLESGVAEGGESGVVDRAAVATGAAAVAVVAGTVLAAGAAMVTGAARSGIGVR
jgi:hypothetical protein